MTRTEQRPNLLTVSRRLPDLTVVFQSGSAVDLMPPLPRSLEDVDVAVLWLSLCRQSADDQDAWQLNEKVSRIPPEADPCHIVAADQGLISRGQHSTFHV